MHVRLFSDIDHVKKADENLNVHVHCLLGQCTYDDIRKGKICDRGTSCLYLLRTENALFILFCLRK